VDPAATRAQEEARALADRGFEAFTQGDYAEAIALFQQAEKLSHSPVVLSFLAQSYEVLGRLLEARSEYERIIADELGEDAPVDFVKAQRRARRQLPLLEQRIPRLLLQIRGAPAHEVKVWLDGQVLASSKLGTSIAVNPGKRTLVLERKGHQPVERIFNASERQISEVDVVFTAREMEVPVGTANDTLRWLLPSMAYGVAFAGSTASIVMTALYFDGAGDLKDRCPENRCAPELEPERDRLSALGTASLVTFAVGVAAGVGGTLLVLFGPKADAPDPNGVSLELAPPLGLRARF
jgi:hypothetical protein